MQPWPSLRRRLLRRRSVFDLVKVEYIPIQEVDPMWVVNVDFE
jgi:hypothetical protein